MERFEQVRCAGLTRTFGRSHALRGIDLSLPAGRVTAMVGANGAGKTTLVSILATLLSPSAGTVFYGDIPHESASQLRGTIGLVSHSAFIYPGLSALENLEFFGRLHHLEDADRPKIMLERVGLPEEAWRRPAAGYSRGMLQMLSLARALLHEPRLLLLDEPFTGLDPEASGRLEGILRTARDEGAIVLLVTHDLESAARLADRTALLTRGRLGHLIDEPIGASDLHDIYREHGPSRAGPHMAGEEA